MAVLQKDAKIPSNAPTTLFLAKHADFIGKYGKDKDDYEFVMSEFLRINGVYWGLTAMEIMRKTEKLDTKDVRHVIEDDLVALNLLLRCIYMYDFKLGNILV